MNDRSEALRAVLARSGSGSTSPRLTDDAFLGLRQLIREASGIAFDEKSRFIVERRLAPRLRALRIDDFEQYYRYLLYSPDHADEIARMLDLVSIRETYFFREQHQFTAFRTELLPRLAEENAASRRLRIWSAGCASGEEPYTIAMLVCDSRLFDAWQVEILGTDLSPQAIASAHRGLYRDASMRAIPDEYRARFFTHEGDNAWLIDEAVRRKVVFERLNLLEMPCGEAYMNFDVVFCRNVLIYFDPETRRVVVGVFYDRLHEGGYLLLGHAETLVNLNTPFKLHHLQRDLIYRR